MNFKIETLVSFDDEPRKCASTLRMKFPAGIRWAAIGTTDTKTARNFANYLLKCCDRVDDIKRKFDEENDNEPND